MLLYSTMLDVKNTLTKEKFIQLVIKWNQESQYQENIIPGLVWDGQMNVRYGDNRHSLEIEEYRSGNTVAIRYQKVENNGRIWNSDYVINFKTGKMHIQLDRSFTGAASDLDQEFSTPHFLTFLIEEGHLQGDRDLPVTREPIYVDKNNSELLAKVTKGKSSYQLPVVYVSKTKLGQYPVDVNLLASKLKGVAHVLVQKSSNYDETIKELNEHYGAVGIYYPNKAAMPKGFWYKETAAQRKNLLENLIYAVMSYCNCQQVGGAYTWDGVLNAISRDRLESQRKERQQAEIEKEQVYSEFDDELKTLQERVDSLTRENEALRAENAGLHSKFGELDKRPVLVMGDEADLYPGEIKELVLSVLDDELNRRVSKPSRRSDVFSDLIEKNEYQGVYRKKKEEIQKILKNYTIMDAKTRKALQNFGFKIEEDGKHYRLTYYGDDRYNTTVAKTPSDARAGKNIAHYIEQTMM